MLTRHLLFQLSYSGSAMEPSAARTGSLLIWESAAPRNGRYAGSDLLGVPSRGPAGYRALFERTVTRRETLSTWSYRS
jgi:hypothetical protein